MVERELKAVVPDPAAVQIRLQPFPRTFAGLMSDIRLDRDGELAAVGEVLRVRKYRATDGPSRAVVAWKGPVSVEDGYKVRREEELGTPDGEAASRLLESLGYRPVSTIDRYVEYFAVADAIVRLEWYPRMDRLVEVEGSVAAIEAAVAALGLPRATFSAESLDQFVARYQSRTGRSAAISLAALATGETPEWPVQ